MWNKAGLRHNALVKSAFTNPWTVLEVVGGQCVYAISNSVIVKILKNKLKKIHVV